MSETKSKDGSFGQQQIATGNDEFNILQFLIKQALGRVNTSTLVKVVAVHAPVGVNPVGFVDVTLLVNQIDGANQPVPHTTVYDVPYVRLQGGKNAMIIDPQVNDIGLCAFAQADISTVKASKAGGNPGSKRRFDIADGMYMGGMLNAAPERYLMIDDDGVTIEGVAAVTIHGNNVTVNATNATVNATTTVNGATFINGDLAVSGKVTATGDVKGAGISLSTHKHSGVTAGGSNTGNPV